MKSEQDRWIQAAKKYGFTVGILIRPTEMILHEEVRDMCRAGTCGQYGKNWSCPPGCGTLKQCREKVAHYDAGILVQTVGKLEDCFDVESMQETEKRHKENFFNFFKFLQKEKEDVFPLGTGCCTVCAKCTYPEMPCRFPHRRIFSLEAYGVLVNEFCRQNGVAYNYGSNKVVYTAACLWNDKNKSDETFASVVK